MPPVEIDGTLGVSLVQDGVITDANLPAGSVLQVVQATDLCSTLGSIIPPQPWV